MGSIRWYIIFRTTFGAFLVICTRLTVLMWITQALRDIDLMTNEGQSIFVFVGITGLIIPLLVQITGDLSKAGMMIPVAAAGLPAAIGGITGVLALLYQEDG